jgi:protein-S-isoprenylcysteine O-methyltransferase Ste14
MKRRIKIQSSFVFVFLILSFFFSKYFFARYRIQLVDIFLDVAGMGILICGFLFRISARGYKQDNTAGGNELVTGGPYSLIRNPMYFGTFLIGSGIILIILNLWTYPLFLAIYLSIYVPQIRSEKKVLSGRFGEKYLEYCKRVPVYFPGLSGFLEGELRQFLPLKWRWVKKELPSFTAVGIIVTAIEVWEDLAASASSNIACSVLELPLIAACLFLVMFIYYRKNGNKPQ